MKGTDVRCPECGAVNCGVRLERTEGWMECLFCGCTARLIDAGRGDLTDREQCVWQVVRPLFPAGRGS